VTALSETLALGGLRTTDNMTRVENSWTALSQQNALKLRCNYISYPYTAVANSNIKEIKFYYMKALFTAIPETRSVRNKRSGNRVPHFPEAVLTCWCVSCGVTPLQSSTHPPKVFTLFHNSYHIIAPTLALTL